MKAAQDPASGRLFVGVDVGGTHVRMGLVDEAGALVRESLAKTASLAEGDRTPVRILDAVAVFLGEEAARVAGLGVGFPSVVSKDRRTVIQTPNVPGLDRVPMAELCEARFPFPCFIEKDVNLLLRHDVEALALRGRDPILGFYIGTGLGNALMFGGRFYTGATGAAGELGHTPLKGASDRCTCGNSGCVEMVVSGKVLAAHVASAHPGSDINRYWLERGGEAFAREFVENLSLCIATEMNLLDPEVAILGGGVLHMEGFPREALVESVRTHLRPPFPKGSALLVYSEESRNAGILGAAAHARDMLAR